MKQHGKKYRNAAKHVTEGKYYTVSEAVALVRKMKYAKFNESLTIDICLNIDPRQADQQVRGTVILPHGTGKTLRIAVFAEGEEAEQARKAGADVVGGADLIKRVMDDNFTEFDVAISTPTLMREVGKLGKVLGPRGLMPNPKAGTVTKDTGAAVREAKAGKVEYRLDRQANVHNAVGKMSFGDTELVENLNAFLEAIKKARPAAAKGSFMKTVTVSSTMGPGVSLDPNA